ncbi:MAG: ABC transporter ATP-binding protein [Cyclobacteriaceae bacterium]
MQLTIKNLTKTYPNGVAALKNVSLTINKGMFGLLGPNGAGKSTLMRTVATLQEADSGDIQLGDINVLEDKVALRRVLGYFPQEYGVYPRISAQKLLDHMAVLKGIIDKHERNTLVDAMLERVNLKDHRKKSVSSYSGGMRQRFGIAQALLGEPKLIIVDEPTAGLDPGERNRFYNLLSEIGENVIVILSTHIVDDVKELCSDMAIIHEGEVLFSGSPQLAVDSLDGLIYERTIEKAEMEEYQQKYTVISSKLVTGKTRIHVHSEEPIPAFSPVEADLEDVFFTKIMGVSAAQL